jgi:hypothetical protein
MLAACLRLIFFRSCAQMTAVPFWWDNCLCGEGLENILNLSRELMPGTQMEAQVLHTLLLPLQQAASQYWALLSPMTIAAYERAARSDASTLRKAIKKRNVAAILHRGDSTTGHYVDIA